MLRELGIVIGKDTKAAEVFESLHHNFMTLSYSCPSDYVHQYWSKYEIYKQSNEGSNNLNGKLFEYILATLCIREGLLPLYLEAKVAFVPNVEYDLMFFSKECGPICWSAKTSLRERYKQADLESIALKYVHRKALSYLVTLSDNEAQNVRKKIKEGDVIGLDDVIVATSSDFDDLVEKLKTYHLSEASTVQVIESTQIVTSEKVENTIISIE